MMLQSLFSLLFLLKFSRSQNCVTIQDEHAIEDEYAPRFGQNCVFPFIFRGKKYDKCTTDADPDDRFWCATKLNSEGEYFDDHWGYCPDACAKEDLGTWKPTGQECGFDLIPQPKIRTSRDIPWLRVSNGLEAEFGEFPYMALLGFLTESDTILYNCGGSLINKWYILTAAHCLVSSRKISEVVLGEFDLDMDPDLENAPKAIRRKPDKIIPHQHYNKRTSNYDIGLIRVSQMVPLGQLAVPICLDWTGQLAKVNEATISGWGRTFGSQNSKQIGQNVEGYTNILVKASVPVWNQTYCESFKKVYPSLSTVIHICAGGIQGSDSCGGDSGGPLAARQNSQWFQLGLVSYGARDCENSLAPGVYTNVTEFLDWIESNLQP